MRKNTYFGYISETKGYRKKKLKKQLKKRGFDDSETWNLDSTISRFIYPRLLRFVEVNNGYPNGLTEEKWNKILGKMSLAFLPEPENYDTEEYTTWRKNRKKGLKLFTKYFDQLWW